MTRERQRLCVLVQLIESMCELEYACGLVHVASFFLLRWHTHCPHTRAGRAVCVQVLYVKDRYLRMFEPASARDIPLLSIRRAAGPNGAPRSVPLLFILLRR